MAREVVGAPLLNHVQLRARYFPITEGAVRPFVGGGAGFLRLERSEGGLTDDCRGRRICLGPGLTESREAVARFNPHVVAGAELTREDRPGSVVFAITRELMASVDDWALNAWRISIGLAFRPR